MAKDNIKRVWVLGAGFSRPLGGPLLNDLLSENPATPLLNTMLEDEGKRIRQYYQIGKRQGLWPHAEAFLDFVETARLEGRNSSGNHQRRSHARAVVGLDPQRGFTTYESISDAARRAIIVDCWSFLETDQTNICDNERWAPFVSWAQKLSKNDTIVTFNYDAVPELLKDCGVGCLRVVRPFSVMNDKTIAEQDNKALVLKLHGSINWGRKFDGTETVDTGNSPIALTNQEFAPVIGFPGPLKQSTCNNALSELWIEAKARLNYANEIIFIGYAFPDTDNYSRTTLLQCLLINSKATVRLALGAQSPDFARVSSMLERFTGEDKFKPTLASGQQFLTEFNLTRDHIVNPEPRSEM